MDEKTRLRGSSWAKVGFTAMQKVTSRVSGKSDPGFKQANGQYKDSFRKQLGD